MSYKLVTPAGSEPLDVDEIKLHLKVDFDDDDALITRRAKGVRKSLESEMRRQFVSASWDLYLDDFSWMILLEKSPITEVTKICYYDSSDSLQTLSTDVYQVDMVSEPARITLKDGQQWPGIFNRLNAVIVRFVAGNTNAAAVPEDIKEIILMLTSYYYDNRGEEMTQARIKALLQSAGWMIGKQKLFRF